MQYLYSKKNSLQNIMVSPKVGQIILTPYEAIEVDTELWDSKAFETIRTRPTYLGLAEKVPSKYVELRKVYLQAVENSEDNSGKLETLQKDIETLKEELSVEFEDIVGKEQNLEEVRNELISLEKKFAKDKDDLELHAKVDSTRELVASLEESLNIQKSEYDIAEKLLKDKQAELDSLQK